MKISSRKLLNIFFPAILILTVVMGVFSYNNNKVFNSTSFWVKHSYAVLSKSDDIYSLTMEIESSSNSYLFTRDSAALAIYQRAAVDVIGSIDSIKYLTLDKSDQQRHIDSLSQIIKAQIGFLNGNIQLQKEKEFDKEEQLEYINQNRFYTRRINTLLGEIFDTENGLLHERETANNKSIVTFHWVFYSMLVCLFALLLNVIWLVVHIFNRQQKEKEITEGALAREKELNEMKSRFVSFASHEFRTPLTTILSSASLIERYQDKNLEEGSAKHLSRIKANVKSLIDLLNDFLSIGKIEEGKIENHPHETNVDEFTDDLVTGMKEMTKEGQHIVTEVIGKHEPIFIDDRLLKNVLNNLLSNAIKYSPVNSDIRLKVVPNNSHVSFIVQDQGIGIPEQEQKHLFETFFRASNATQTAGTGLGLCIVKRYLSIMGGTIEFSSKENEGTTFEIKIPKKASE